MYHLFYVPCEGFAIDYVVNHRIMSYDEFCYIKRLTDVPVDLWESVRVTEQITMLLDEDGYYKELDVNDFGTFLYGSQYDCILGDVFLCSSDGEDFVYLTDSQMDELIDVYHLTVLRQPLILP